MMYVRMKQTTPVQGMKKITIQYAAQIPFESKFKALPAKMNPA